MAAIVVFLGVAIAGGGGALWEAMGSASSVLATIPIVASARGAEGIVVDGLDARAFVSTVGGPVSLLKTRTGRRVATILAGGQGTAIAVASRAGHAIIVSQSGVSAVAHLVSVHIGTIIRTIIVGQRPAAAAVDNQIGHAFVTTVGVTRPDGTPIGRGRLSMLDSSPCDAGRQGPYECRGG